MKNACVRAKPGLGNRTDGFWFWPSLIEGFIDCEIMGVCLGARPVTTPPAPIMTRTSLLIRHLRTRLLRKCQLANRFGWFKLSYCTG
jgi:hypothetical protein